MSDVKQVKVDNWGIYFLQRLKHFFNRTDYCDLTLQFQDNAQLKVHRLVLSACTEYFELLERTCEMYEDCLVMPDDLQADVVVPIINFMYTGQLEFKMDLLEKLYQTSLVMNMPVLTKLLASHRSQQSQSNHQTRPAPNNFYGKRYLKHSKAVLSPSSSNTSKRNFTNAFENADTPRSKKPHIVSRTESNAKNGSQEAATSSPKFPIFSEKNKHLTKEPRPTRYELPEELDEDNIFDNSFMNISYTSKPLMVHPETTKQYTSKRIKLFEEGTSSRFVQGSSNNDIVECKKISVNDSLFIDDNSVADDNDTFQSLHVKDDSKDASQLFDQIIDNNDCSNITIETKNNKQSGNLDHAKIISEVLKKYPHLVKSNKHIKLKILNTPNKPKKTRASNISNEEKDNKVKNETPDFTYETDVIDSKEAARLIALGAENIRGPWICLICGTPGKALHFTSYYNFRKHLVDIHNEKPVPNICEYCGLKSQKRNYLVHHQLTKHGVEPPSHYNFPKCNYCKYIALNEALMVKHKLTHTEVRSFRRNVSTTAFTTSNLMLDHGQKSGSKYGERKHNLQCIYCLRIFLRENNLYAHLKTNHKEAAKNDGLIDDSDEEIQEEEEKPKSKHNSNESSNYIKVELPVNYDNSFDDNNVQYQIERRADGNIHVVSKKPRVVMPITKHKILNPGFIMQNQNNSSLPKQQKPKSTINTTLKRNEYLQELCVSPTSNVTNEEIVLIDNNEYIVQDFQLIPKKEKNIGEYIMTNTVNTNKDESIQSIIPTTSMEYHNITHNASGDAKVFVKKPTNANQPIQIVVSNEEEYKALVSNPSVIFEDGDSNKALTVLAPGTSSLETATIDLDNTQSNDMMIIQDDFSINVSETVAANNSNIVVVYSHPVEDQNKQYQIITTQAVEAQFVPSSAIITQNYETVTTCTPVVSAHTALDNSWQNNIHTNINKLPLTSTDSELHTMTVAESVTISPESDSNTNINEFSEVPITTSESVAININQIVESQNQNIENNFNESNVLPNITEDMNNVPVCQPSSIITLEHPTIITDDLQQTLTENNIQPLSSTDLDKSAPISTFINTIEEPLTTNTLEPITENADQVTPSELGPVFDEEILVPENQSSIADAPTVIESTIEEKDVSSEPLNENVISEVDNSITHSSDEHIGIEQSTDEPLIEEESNVETEKLEEQTNEMAVEETIENIARDIAVNPNPIDKPESPKITESLEDNSVTKVAIAQIENLASEWSEDESETLTENENKTDKSNSEAKNDEVSEISEVEESIENIQQEMEKQVSVDLVPYTDEDVSSSQDENLPKLPELQEDSKASDEIQTNSKEKISLLLNDWDDNDSQEDSPLVPCEAKINDHDPKSQNTDDNLENDSAVVDKSEISKNDNIKSLVSDWDEDDEENKE
ncbi:centrosome-associated zinc finger protein CP190 [Vanessa atalanta]|uniref:centrosome-associated zinc finger protein CP190 n=1 Tax=Vanessa atalanta TaxID=42275 RepID=UPI001FCD03EA|nr:centrosome-associated zinc finger protein CP190 [Vanessa atalanta]